MTARLRVGLVGAGYWGKNLLRVFQALPGAEVCAVADETPQAAKALARQLPAFASVEAMLQSCPLDAVLVATPPSTHYGIARTVLSAGKHCWVEKPLALRSEQARELVELARKAGVQLFVDETFLYDPLVCTAREWIRSGRLGRVYHASFERLGQGRIRRDSDVWWNSAPHDLSIINYWFESPLREIAVRGFAYLQPNVADVAAGVAELEDGTSIHIYVSWIAPVKIATATVSGERGMLVYEGRFGKRKLEFYEFAVTDPAEVTANVVPIQKFAMSDAIAGGNEEPLALAAEAFLEAIRTGMLPPSAGEFSQRVVEMLTRGQPMSAVPRSANFSDASLR